MNQHPVRGGNDQNTRGRNQITNPSSTSNSHLSRNDDPLNALSDHHITQLATLLRLPSSNHLITTSHKGWLTCQREDIAKDLDSALKRRRRLSLSWPTLLARPVHRTPRLCSSHRGLRPDIIAACSSQLRELWELGVEEFEVVLFEVENKRSINGLKRRSRDDWQKMLREYLEGLITDVVGVSGLMVPERELRTRFGRWYLKNGTGSSASFGFGGVVWGWEELDRTGKDNALFAGPEEKPFRFIATGCEACVLATVGRGGSGSNSKGKRRGKDGVDILMVLKAALLVIYHHRKGITGTEDGAVGGDGVKEEDKDRKLPGLFRLVEAWIKLAEAEEDRGEVRMKDSGLRLGDKVKDEHGHQDEERRILIQGKHTRGRRPRQWHTQRPHFPREKQKVNNSLPGHDHHGELPLTPYLQQPHPHPQPKPHPQRLSRPQLWKQEQHPRPQQSRLQQKSEKQQKPQREKHRTRDGVHVSHSERNNNDSVPSIIHSTRTTGKERQSGRRDKLPKVYAVISQLPIDATLYPRQIARRRSGREDLRGEFQSHDGDDGHS